MWRVESPVAAARSRRDILKAMRLLALNFALAASILAQQPEAPIRTGPAIGSIVPRFEAPDQNGRVQTLGSIAGPKGALLVFYRSADW